VTSPPSPKAIAIIPARFASTRFPGKMLAADTGRPLVQHTVEAARRATSISEVVVAADDPRIAEALKPFGTRVIQTSPDHPNGTSRLAEAADLLGLADDAVIVNVQGDEPEIEPHIIDAAVAALASSDAPVATVASPFAPDENPADPNIVKAIRAASGLALYFTRALAPFDRDGDARDRVGESSRPLKHVGLYVYRRGFLRTYTALEPTPLELTERLEQLRILEHGYPIALALADARHHGIDTAEQYRAFVRRHAAP
jgi:3-deoxy-manno-octulosonate cytidylyltransferase (CMP-KDO synthetase)